MFAPAAQLSFSKASITATDLDDDLDLDLDLSRRRACHSLAARTSAMLVALARRCG